MSCFNNMAKLRRTLLSFAAFAVLAATALVSTAKVLQPEPDYAQITKSVARYFPRHHLSQMVVDDLVSERTWKNYLNTLDPEHVFFLQSDLDQMKTQEHELDDQLKQGDTMFAFKAFELLKKRIEDRCAYVDRLLAKGFDFSVKETYQVKRKDTPWPADEKEWDELWRKRIKNEYLRQVVAGELRKDEGSATNVTAFLPTTTSSVTIVVTNVTGVIPAASTNTGIITTGPSTGSDTNATAVAPSPTNQAMTAAAPPTPAESISKRYHQLLTITQDNDADLVFQRYLTAFASAYDPHSSYMSATSMQDFDIDMKLSLVGIGALLSPEDGAAKVVRIIPGGPADRDKREKRLQPGDKIIQVGQGNNPPEDILHLPLTKIVQKIRGGKGTKVVLVVIPASDPTGSSLKTVDLIRDEVKLEEQAAKWKQYEINDSTGAKHELAVINLPAFYANMKVSAKDPDYRSAADDVEKLLKNINEKNMEGLILDLRNNGGGSLVDAVKLTGLFIPSGPVVQVKEANDNPRWLPDNNSSIAYSGPMIVLVNRLSASASEILAGAMQDYGRAIIIGDSRTHGKGTVQTVVNVRKDDPKLGAMKITTAVFYRISGGSTQLRGVVPDIVLPSFLDFMELGEDSLDNPITWDAVGKAPYNQWDDLAPSIAKARELSEKRIEIDKRFQVYRNLLKRIEQIYKMEEVPLDMESRRELAKTEKEISDLQEKLNSRKEGDADKDGDDLKNDIILEESLKILADFTSIAPPRKDIGKPAAPDGKDNKMDRIMEWLKDHL